MSNLPPESEHARGGCGLDVAAYALGALEADEARAFEAHLEGCTMCREELAEFKAVVDRLPMSARAHRPPDTLRSAIMNTVRAEAALRAPRPAAATAPPQRRWRWAPRPALALASAVAVLALAVVGGVGLLGAGHTSRIYSAQVSGPGTARVAVTDGHATLIVRHFAPPPQGKIYEVWLARPHQSPQPTRVLFDVTTSGSGDVEVPGDLHGVSSLMVTPEPAGGSLHPTHAPVIRVSLT